MSMKGGNTMAVFYDTGGGDIYAGPTREAVIAAMRDDIGQDFIESDVVEVSGLTEMRVRDENDALNGELVTLAQEYGDGTDAYCIASDNC